MDSAPEKISAFEKRLKRQVIGKPHRFLAVVPLGFEQTFIREFNTLGIQTTICDPGIAQASNRPQVVGDGKVDGKEIHMSVKEGDKVVYGKYSGTEFKLGEEEFVIVKMSDILAIVE